MLENHAECCSSANNKWQHPVGVVHLFIIKCFFVCVCMHYEIIKGRGREVG